LLELINQLSQIVKPYGARRLARFENLRLISSLVTFRFQKKSGILAIKCLILIGLFRNCLEIFRIFPTTYRLRAATNRAGAAAASGKITWAKFFASGRGGARLRASLSEKNRIASRGRTIGQLSRGCKNSADNQVAERF
jgi:hypothetical protein